MTLIVRYAPSADGSESPHIGREVVFDDVCSWDLDDEALWIYPEYGYRWIKRDIIEAVRSI